MNTNLISELRKITSAGIVDCRDALLQCNNDIDNAILYLRKKSSVVASNKSERSTNVLGTVTGRSASLVSNTPNIFKQRT